jgi:hypothetical protein
MMISHAGSVLRPLSRPGIALPAAIFGIVIVSLITAGAWTMTELDSKAATNRVDAATALRLAHTAETHAIAVLRSRLADTAFNRILSGYDDVENSDDDGLLDGYPTLGDSLNIPAAGRVVDGIGTYFVKITDDPAEQDGQPYLDGNSRMRITCRGLTPRGSVAEINLIVGTFPLPAIAVDGSVEISGRAVVNGPCGGIHANGNVLGGGRLIVTRTAAATGALTVDVNGNKTSHQPAVPIPDLNPADFCGAADYVYIGSGSGNYSGDTWKPSAADIEEGKTYCVIGNVEFQTDVGGASNYRHASIIASGSIKLGGKKVWLDAAHPEDVVLLAGGDLDLQGQASFDGMVYAGGQVYISDNPSIQGQLLVKNKQSHPGANYFEWGDNQGLLISGDPMINFHCGGTLGSRHSVLAWYPTIGS